MAKKAVKKVAAKEQPKKESRFNNPLAAFYAKGIKDVEKKTRIYNNTVSYSSRLSSNILCYDWICGGGMLPGLSIISGAEQSGKTTACYHAQAQSIFDEMPLTIFWDAEGTLSPKYAANIWSTFDLDLQAMIDDTNSGYRYYRENVIEKFFDFMVGQLNRMPIKEWNPHAASWSYRIPKRDEYFKGLMDALGLKADKKLTNDHFYTCLTDNDRPEGLVVVDSFAAMITDIMEEEEERGGQRAQEASAFSMNLKRVMAKIQSRQFIMLGTNQLRKIPGKVYGGPDEQEYEPGGEALKFYSQLRARSYSRRVADGFDKDPKNGKICIEPSVEGTGVDSYMFKEFKNTKNKTGTPLLRAGARVWTRDRNGKGRGYDPVYDTYEYLVNTKQLQEHKGKMKFALRDTAGKVSKVLNDAKPFEWTTFKELILSETTARKDLLRSAANKLDINVNPKLRSKLFDQMQRDQTLYQAQEEFKKKAPKDYESL